MRSNVHRLAIGLTCSFMTLVATNGHATSGELTTSKRWTGDWSRRSVSDPATLSISQVNSGGFKFLLDASSGVNVGNIEGAAQFDADRMRATATVIDGPVKCAMSFRISDETTKPLAIEVDADPVECEKLAGKGVTFDGKFLSATAVETFAPSFDCTKELSPIETAICSNKVLADADRLLDSLFKELQADGPFERGDAKLKKQQKSWLAKRDQTCAMKNKKLKTPQEPPSVSCLANSYLQRLVELKRLSDRGDDGGVLRLSEFLKANVDDSKTALWDDPLVNLLLYISMGAEHFDTLKMHAMRFADPDERKPGTLTELEVFANMRGDTQEAGIVLTRGGCLWAALPVFTQGKPTPTIFAPASRKTTHSPEKLPIAIREWLDHAKMEKWKSPVIQFVVPTKC